MGVEAGEIPSVRSQTFVRHLIIPTSFCLPNLRKRLSVIQQPPVTPVSPKSRYFGSESCRRTALPESENAVPGFRLLPAAVG